MSTAVLPGDASLVLHGHQEVYTALCQLDAPQVVLLLGPEGVGKQTLALFVTKAHGVSPANLLAGYSKPLNAENVAEILTRARVRSVGPTAVIVDAGTLSSTAANSLLKLIESPPKGWRFYFHSAGEVLPTIVSRAATYRCRPLTDVQVALVLQAHGVSDEKVSVVAPLAHGRPGEAYRLLGLLEYKPLALRILGAALNGDTALCAEVSRALSAISGDDRQEVAGTGDTVRGRQVVGCLRRAVLEALLQDPGVYTEDEVSPLAELFPLPALVRIHGRLCNMYEASGFLVVRWFTSVVTAAVARREAG